MFSKFQEGVIALAMILILLVQQVEAQVRVSGFVKDAQSGEVLVNAHISGQKQGIYSNQHGYFSLLTSDSLLRVSYVGYQAQSLVLGQSDTLVLVLLSSNTTLDEVLVETLRVPKANVSTLSSQEMNLLPALGGKPDVLKALQFLPGVQSQNEGSSLILVRGGTPGQNLYLIDNIPLIYVNHLGGFTSVFNPDMINSVELHKGGFPARLGGKLSSVVDITQKEGDGNQGKGNVSVGITDASFSLEGPIKSDRLRFIVNGRKTLVDPLMALASSFGDYIISYGFHDLNAKVSWRPNAANSFFFNFYQGDDYLNYWVNQTQSGVNTRSRFSNVWGNWLGSARWNRVYSPKLFSTSSISFTHYRLKERQAFGLRSEQEVIDYYRKYRASVGNASLRSLWYYQANAWLQWEGGLQVDFLQHQPNRIEQSSGSGLPTELILSTESAVFAEANVQLSDKQTLHVGTRVNFYQNGRYQQWAPEPRLRWQWNQGQHQWSASLMRVHQFSHLLFTAGDIASNQVWIPADASLQASYSNQITFSWNQQSSGRHWQWGAEVYYKTLHQLATYKEGYQNLSGDGAWREKVLSGGSGRAYGLESTLRKSSGVWTGWLSYTYARSFYEFPEINHGNEYVFEYDRPHNLTLSVGRKLGSKWDFNTAWIYQTGLPYTPAIGRQLIINPSPGEGELPYFEALIFGERNSARMRDYHRLDLAFNYHKLTKRGRRATWTFSVYNAYNRQNPYYYYYNKTAGPEFPRPEEGFVPLNMYQVSFMPIIPSAAYKVYFDDIRFQRPTKSKMGQRVKRWWFMEN